MLDGRALRVCVAQGEVLSVHTRRAPAPPLTATANLQPFRALPSPAHLPPAGKFDAKPASDGEGPRKRKTDQNPGRPRITQQFRERHNMTYEFDCSGVPLVLRVFFPIGDHSSAEWRMEARTSSACEAPVAMAHAPSRAQALELVAQRWRTSMPDAAAQLDWSGVAQAMSDVRAL
jgi:hypothetical protein